MVPSLTSPPTVRSHSAKRRTVPCLTSPLQRLAVISDQMIDGGVRKSEAERDRGAVGIGVIDRDVAIFGQRDRRALAIAVHRMPKATTRPRTLSIIATNSRSFVFAVDSTALFGDRRAASRPIELTGLHPVLEIEGVEPARPIESCPSGACHAPRKEKTSWPWKRLLISTSVGSGSGATIACCRADELLDCRSRPCRE